MTVPAEIGWALLLNVAATLFMTGVIWFVQVVHYPLMAEVGPDSFAAYEAAHTRRTGWVVAPTMLVEAVTAAYLVIFAPVDVPRWQTVVGFSLVVLIWLSTALLQVPQHRKLECGLDRAAHGRLVSTNWLRVIAWTLRSALVVHWLM